MQDKALPVMGARALVELKLQAVSGQQSAFSVDCRDAVALQG